MKRKTLLLLVFHFIVYGAYCQDLLQLASCDVIEYEVNDNTDANGNFTTCEALVVLTNSASYSDNVCQLSNIKWTVLVDLDNDGTNDIEYKSDLPSDDNMLDDTDGNGIPDMYIPTTTDGEEQSIELPYIEGPNSNHKVRWLVSDDCDLGDLCVTNVSVVDKKSPTPLCVSISTVIFDAFDNEIFAEDFNIGVFDNCTAQQDLRFSFSGDSIMPYRLITCDDVINSPILIDMYVWDENDNTDFCRNYLQVIPTDVVDCGDYYDINGHVETEAGAPITNVEVTLNTPWFHPNYPITTITDEDGFYDFGEHTTVINYNLTLKKTDNKAALLSTLDLVYIQLHILGIIPFTSPYKIIAADVNGDNQVKASDLSNLRKLILGIIPNETSDDFWEFFRKTYEFPDPSDPWSINLEDFDAQYEINSITVNTDFDFIGIKKGNVSN